MRPILVVAVLLVAGLAGGGRAGPVSRAGGAGVAWAGDAAASPAYQGEPAAAWVERLRAPDRATRRRAALAALRLSPFDAGVAPAVARIVAGPAMADVRADAAWALRPRTGADVAVLVRALSDPAEAVREAALRSLGELGPRAPALAEPRPGRAAVVAALLAVAEDGRREGLERGVALDALVGLEAFEPATLARVAGQLGAERDAVARNAADVLAAAGSPATAVLVAALDDPSRRAQAARVLLEAHEPVTPSAPEGRALLDRAVAALDPVSAGFATAWRSDLPIATRADRVLASLEAATEFDRTPAVARWMRLGAGAADEARRRFVAGGDPRDRVRIARLLVDLARATAAPASDAFLGLGDADATVREATARGLRGDAAATLPGTVARLADALRREPDPRVVDELALALVDAGADDATLGPTWAALTPATRTRPTVRLLEASARVDLDALVACVGTAEAQLRWAAGRRLVGLGAAAAPAVPRLARALEGDEVARDGAFDVLGGLGVVAAAAEPSLRRLLTAGDVDVRRRAALTLELLGEAAAPAATVLLAVVRDREVRASAVRALRHASTTHHAACIAALAPLLSSDDQDTQRAAAATLARLGPAGRSALVVAFARAAPGSEDVDAVWAAIGGFEGAPDALATLDAALDDPRPAVRGGAAEAVAGVAAPADARRTRLRRALADAHWYVRGRAALGCARLTHDDPSAGDDLVALLRDRDVWVRAMAQQGGLDAAAGAVGAIARALHHPEPVVRSGAAASLRGPREGERALVADLEALLARDTDAEVLRQAAAARRRVLR